MFCLAEADRSGEIRVLYSCLIIETVSDKTKLTYYPIRAILGTVKALPTEKRVHFMRRGQVVIPSWLRREFAIEEGTRAIVSATPDGILLRPITAALVERGFGLLKRQSDDKTLAEEWAEHKRSEIEREQARHARHGTG